MANNKEFADVIDQFEDKPCAADSKEPDDATQADLNGIAKFVNYIYEDIQNYSQVMELKITQQPQSNFSFRFKSQAKASNGHLNGRNATGRGCKNYPRVELRQCSNGHLDSDGYFIRCTLHQAMSAGETTSIISPHLLYRTAEYAEMEMWPCVKEAPLVQSFTLENFTILKTARKDWFQVLFHKMQELQGQHLSLTDCSEIQRQQSSENFARIANEQVKKPQDKVRLCFEAFQHSPRGYVKVAGPTYSECISNGDPPQIELCNTSAAMHELTIMTIKVNAVRPKDTILIFHDDDENDDGHYETSDWQTTITIEEEMIYEQSAVIFQMPIYRGNKRNNGQEIIKCSIQLERLKDGAHSNKASFYYINTMKRRRKQFDVEDKLIEVLRNGSNISFKSVAAVHLKSYKIKSRMLQEELFNIYENSKAMDYEQKSKLVKDVREFYISYELAQSNGNSLLHDILLDADSTVYDMDLYKIIEHLELQDLVRQSINIYGETVLMFACIYNRPLLMRALIDMGSSVTAQDGENGNNVLHMAMQQQSVECRNSLIQAMKMNTNFAASFIKALGSHNLRGMTPLHLTVLQNNVAIVAELLHFCKIHNAFEVFQLGQLSDGNTILHLAVLNRFEAMRSCILQHSGDSFVNIINYADNTAEELEKH